MTSPFAPHDLSKQWKTLVVQVDAEGAAAAVAAMDRAGATALRAAAAQPRGQAQMLEDARQRQLLFEVREVEGRWRR